MSHYEALEDYLSRKANNNSVFPERHNTVNYPPVTVVIRTAGRSRRAISPAFSLANDTPAEPLFKTTPRKWEFHGNVANYLLT